MSCFVCFGSAQDGEAKKQVADAKDPRKDGPPDRGVARVGSGARVCRTGSRNCSSLLCCGFELCGVRLGRVFFSLLAAREP